METKCVNIEVKSLDESEGIVEAYANVYLNEDSDGDISMPGSFTKTVTENRKRIRVLKDHDSRITLGVPVDIDPADVYGLKTITQFNLKKEISRDMFSDILLAHKSGLNAELSIGYGKVKRDTKDNRKITEYLWLGEYSFLSSWAANEKATVTGVKQMLATAYNLDYSDNRLLQIETLLKALDTQPPEPDTAAEQSLIISTIKNFTLRL